jgi:hypothetical protein
MPEPGGSRAISSRCNVAKLSLDRTLASGRRIRVSLESLDIPSHTAVGRVAGEVGVNLALVNVLDVAEEEIRKLHLEPLTIVCARRGCDDPDCEAAGRCLAQKQANPVGGACGDNPERISDR